MTYEQEYWLSQAISHNVNDAHMYDIHKLKSVEYFWLDGACGYKVADGDSLVECVTNAIQRIQTYYNTKHERLIAFSPIY